MEFVYDFIVERKQASDLCSSIVDGRFEDQIERLKSSRFKRVFYLVEGRFQPGFSKESSLKLLIGPCYEVLMEIFEK